MILIIMKSYAGLCIELQLCFKARWWYRPLHCNCLQRKVLVHACFLSASTVKRLQINSHLVYQECQLFTWPSYCPPGPKYHVCTHIETTLPLPLHVTPMYVKQILLVVSIKVPFVQDWSTVPEGSKSFLISSMVEYESASSMERNQPHFQCCREAHATDCVWKIQAYTKCEPKLQTMYCNDGKCQCLFVSMKHCSYELEGMISRINLHWIYMW